MRSDYETRAKRFVNQLMGYLHDCTTVEDYANAVTAFRVDHPRRNIHISNGLTRVAIITSDYVIKIDYNPVEIDRFGGCEDEIAIYSEAEHDGMAYLFAKISRYICRGQVFYIMPRIEGVGRYEYDDAWEYMTEDEYHWCTDHGIFDLHYMNYGWRDGKVCLIDYGAHES